jgi:phosphoribosylamine--glycine ligase
MPGVTVRFAGVAARDGTLVTSGGRVLTVVGRAVDYESAIDRAYAGVRRIAFEGVQYRTDIGARAVPRESR